MNRLSDTLSRRRLLQSGGHAWLSGNVSGAVCGTLAAVAAQQQSSASSPFAPESLSASFGRAKSIIWLYLSGGPSQYETFDPKPVAALL